MAPKSEKIVTRRKVFREDVRNVLREEIFSNKLKPGDRILETYWSNRLGVSQGPVREALRDLEAMGLVETIPFKGSRVRVLSKKDVEDNYSTRLCLEIKSIKDAISLLNTKEQQDLHNQLCMVMQQMQSAVKNGDLGRFIESDTLFHSVIIHATGNQVLFKLWEQCNIRNWNIIPEDTRQESLQKLQEEHQKLMMAIYDRDSYQAVTIVEEHIVSLMDNLIRESDL